ncbi:MAG TPA: alpha-ketoglutarate-dependent dioxygenase AlkB [Rhizomicrobium sp.]|nr:alpha-ketoglutarate-dependent dioxygenase AlkB [Rhizomicrobium sp.]
MVTPLTLKPGVTLWREYFTRTQQQALLADVLARVEEAPFYRPVMPKTGAPFSVDETNFGPLGWVSDHDGYRYDPRHPFTDKPWPAMPPALLDLWASVADYPAPPECCLVNLYRAGAKMGLHQDREPAADAPVLSVSLGDDALFRFGGDARKGSTQSVKLSSGDVLAFGGPARAMYHGIDRIVAGSSQLVPGGGRINLTLRRVTPKQNSTRSGGRPGAFYAPLRA